MVLFGICNTFSVSDCFPLLQKQGMVLFCISKASGYFFIIFWYLQSFLAPPRSDHRVQVGVHLALSGSSFSYWPSNDVVLYLKYFWGFACLFVFSPSEQIVAYSSAVSTFSADYFLLLHSRYCHIFATLNGSVEQYSPMLNWMFNITWELFLIASWHEIVNSEFFFLNRLTKNVTLTWWNRYMFHKNDHKQSKHSDDSHSKEEGVGGKILIFFKLFCDLENSSRSPKLVWKYDRSYCIKF